MLAFYIFVFFGCCLIFYFSGELVLEGLMRMARFLGWREFVVGFIVMAFASSLPNLFLGITSALRSIPQLSFGDVAGNNLIAMTLAVAIAVFVVKAKEIPAESRAIQTTSIFTIAAAILPIMLIFDGELSRIDGILLIALFVFYFAWLFSKKERFTKVYNGHETPILKEFKIFIKDSGRIIFGVFLLIVAAQGIVASAQFFAESFAIPIILVGILITGLGNALPEIYFAVVSAKKGETWMILGDLMGAVVVPATLVLGIVALICPIKIADPSSLVIARFFLIIAAMFFFFCVRSGCKITKKEAFVLLGIYIIFVLVECLVG